MHGGICFGEWSYDVTCINQTHLYPTLVSATQTHRNSCIYMNCIPHVLSYYAFCKLAKPSVWELHCLSCQLNLQVTSSIRIMYRKFFSKEDFQKACISFPQIWFSVFCLCNVWSFTVFHNSFQCFNILKYTRWWKVTETLHIKGLSKYNLYHSAFTHWWRVLETRSSVNKFHSHSSIIVFWSFVYLYITKVHLINENQISTSTITKCFSSLLMNHTWFQQDNSFTDPYVSFFLSNLLLYAYIGVHGLLQYEKGSQHVT